MDIKTIFQSSVDPSKISLTVQSITKFAIFVTATFLLSKGMNPAEATTAIQQISDILISVIPAGFAVFHACEAVYGIVRKFFVVK